MTAEVDCQQADLPVVAITTGDPAGVGPEVAVAAASSGAVSGKVRPLLVGHRRQLLGACDALGLQVELKCRSTSGSEPQQSTRKPLLNYVQPCGIAAEEIQPGEISPEAGSAGRRVFELGVELVREGVASALATAPLDKRSLRMAGAPYVDHTSGLARLTGADSVRTMFETGPLRVFFLTRHLSLREAIDALSAELVVRNALAACEDLRRLKVCQPRLALAALNPHASDGGMMGDEEEQILLPAVSRARRLGVDLQGPIPADAVFHQALEGEFDAVLSLYHDQGHIAAKTRDFYGTVSLTFGLPFLRTSVDHGTAKDIAGQGVADCTSMVNAVLAAGRYGEYWPAG